MAWLWAESIDSREARLSADEVHHLQHVLRRKPGERLQLIDGRGTRCDGHWLGGDLLEVEHLEAWPRSDVLLVLALGGRTAAEEGVRRAAEFGVGSVQPVLSDRSRDAGARGRINPVRFERIIRSGCAQSGNPWLPTMRPVLSWRDFLATADGERCIALTPGGTAPAERLASATVVAVGPEGGWTDGELADVETAALGSYVLRSEVAVAAALAIVTSLRRPHACDA